MSRPAVLSLKIASMSKSKQTPLDSVDEWRAFLRADFADVAKPFLLIVGACQLDQVIQYHHAQAEISSLDRGVTVIYAPRDHVSH